MYTSKVLQKCQVCILVQNTHLALLHKLLMRVSWKYDFQEWSLSSVLFRFERQTRSCRPFQIKDLAHIIFRLFSLQLAMEDRVHVGVIQVLSIGLLG